MSAEVFYTVALVFIIFFGILIYSDIRANHRRVMDKQELIAGSVTVLSNKVIRFEDSVAEYRKRYIEHIESYNATQEHLAKQREQMQRLHKRQNIIKQGMVKRFEVVVPNDFKGHLRSVAKKLEQFS